MISQDVKVNRVIASCRTVEHFQSAYLFIRNAMLPLQEKTWWMELLKDKATETGINWAEISSNELST